MTTEKIYKKLREDLKEIKWHQEIYIKNKDELGLFKYEIKKDYILSLIEFLTLPENGGGK